MTLSELEEKTGEKMEEARRHGATDDSEVTSGVNHGLQIDISKDGGYERQYSIEI